MTLRDPGIETLAARRGAPAAAARQVDLAGAPERRLVVVSNRVGPIARGKAAQGGLAVAVGAALEEARAETRAA